MTDKHNKGGEGDNKRRERARKEMKKDEKKGGKSIKQMHFFSHRWEKNEKRKSKKDRNVGVVGPRAELRDVGSSSQSSLSWDGVSMESAIGKCPGGSRTTQCLSQLWRVG